ncbi:MAG: DUF11 domain-containing protein, partial [Phycisphaerales bacterium]
MQNYVRGNFIGTKLDGITPLPNGDVGVRIKDAPENVIGGTIAEERNIVSGNLLGGVVIEGLSATKNKVQGNYIGTNKDGTGANMGNSSDGVLIDGAPDNIIGGLSSTPGVAPGNIISGNWSSGIHIKGSGASGNKVQGNVIGRDKNDAKLSNVHHGVLIEDAPKNTIGAETTESAPTPGNPHPGNLISANGGDGVRVKGDSATGNTIRLNQIYENKGLGINLLGGKNERPDFVTPNDADDKDDGPNGRMNFPVGVTAWFDGIDTIIISGVLTTAKPESCKVDIYANEKIDDSGFGEGRFYLDSVTPDESGEFHLKVVDKAKVNKTLYYPFLSATATNLEDEGSTSEFSPVYGDPDGDKFVDSDGDGLPDEWETKGIDFDGDGKIDLDLKKEYKAKPDHKDVFVEVDWMSGFKPPKGAIDAVKTAFDRAPVKNLDGSTGITLRVNDYLPGDIIPHMAKTWFKKTPAANDDFWDLKKEHFGSLFILGSGIWKYIGARSLVFHYGIFADELALDPGEEPAGGAAELHGDDFIITLGNTTSDWERAAGCFMHELGHNLGLHHGGPMARDPVGSQQSKINYKPNYLSVMNYSYVDADWIDRPLDYSRFDHTTLVELNELFLNESDGITGAMSIPGLQKPPAGITNYPYWEEIVYTYPEANQAKVATAKSDGMIDWNHDKSISFSIIQANINDKPEQLVTQNLDLLQSREDWNHLRYDFRASQPHFTGVAVFPHPDERLAVSKTLDVDGDGFSNADDNARFVYNPDQTDSDGDGIGDAGELLSLTLSETSVAGGSTTTGTVSLLLLAPPEGARVDLFTSDPWLVDLPYSVTIPAGSNSGAFTITTSPLLTTNTPVTIYASYYWADLLEAELIVAPEADLEVVKTTLPDPVDAGTTLTYTVTVTNNGPGNATGVTLTDTLPEGVIFLSASGTSQGSGSTRPGLAVRIDYTFDTNGFFDTQEKKDLLQLAADTILAAFGDDLDAISPGGSNTWTATFENPSTGATESIADLVVAENELIIYAGGRDLSGTPEGAMMNGLGGPGGGTVSGSPAFVAAVTTRGEAGADAPNPTDFGPWGGSIAFDTHPDAKFHFGQTTEGLDPDEVDFLSVALHELGHLLGIGTSASWDTFVDSVNREFTGPASVAQYDLGGNIPLELGLGHWLDGTTDGGVETAMDPLMTVGTRKLFTSLDFAALDDIGWDVFGLPGSDNPVRCAELFGTVTCDVGTLGPGEGATVTIEVMPTKEGTITNIVSVAADGIDPDPSNNTAQIITTVNPKAAIVVNTTDDVDDGICDGTHCSLREAINLANLIPDPDTITFNVPGPGPHTIRPTSALPTITDPVIIDGTTEPDFAGSPVVELDGSLAGLGVNGLHITAGNSTVRGLVINRFQVDELLRGGNGILLETNGSNIIE